MDRLMASPKARHFLGLHCVSTRVGEKLPAPGDVKERLEWWLKDMGHQDCKLKLQRTPKKSNAPGYGMMAASGIQKGSIIVEVPKQAFLSEETARCCQYIGRISNELTSWQLMCTHLLCERARESESHWYPYLSILPSEQELPELHPMFWPQNLRKEWLEGSPMLDKLENRLRMCREDYESIVAAGANSLLPFDANPLTEVSVKWAATILLSRGFSLDLADEEDPDGESSVVLVPWADMINHSSSAGRESCLIYDEEAKKATLRAHKSYDPGEQVFDSYGPGLSGSQLLLDYGFVDEANHVQAIDIPATVLGPLKSTLNASLLKAAGLPYDGTELTLLPEEADETILALLRVAVASREELGAAGWREDVQRFSKVKLESKASSAMMHFSQLVNEDNESEVLRRLTSACKELAKRYPTSIEEDMKMLKGESKEVIPWSRKQALRALIAEKQALEGASSVYSELYKKLWR